jgi:hypothetical protein
LNQPTNGNAVAPTGSTIVRFELNGPFDPSNLAYYIVINTAGNGMPFWLGPNSNYINWSYVFEVGGANGATTTPVLYQVYQNPQTSSGVQFFPVQYADAAYQFQPSVPVSNVPGGFQFTFNRCILNIPPPTSGATPAPTVAPSTSPSATPTAVPSSPISGVSCPPFSFPALTNVWNINLLTVDKNGFPIDSLQPSLNSTSFTFTIDVSQVQDVSYVKPIGSTQVNPAEAGLYGIEVLTTP